MKSLLYFLILSCLFSCTNKTNAVKTKLLFKEVNQINLARGTLFRADSISSKYITTRPVDVWLPSNYTTEKEYAVVYMHDGQMLFDSTTTWNKQEWKVDEVAGKLNNDKNIKNFIVVAVHNIAELRWQDLFPTKAITNNISAIDTSLAKDFKKDNFDINKLTGDQYLKFLVTELKPIIDTSFSVKKDAKNTFVMGSSMGGLMSMYAISEYPNVFGGAACLSTHWVGFKPMENNVLPSLIFKYAASNIPDSKTHKLYFDYGTETLDAYYLKHVTTVDSIYLNKGYTSKNYRNLKFKGENHSENSWQKRISIPLTFLLKNN
ncbi:alpha/beta hydrolase [Cellulophaga omnivescoria]|uniref:alpha/beta hydrolase n=1 Tax=Cellulophaga omnivescoria TaxID=1888890 RepID=UPI0022F01DD1|nr:alpha/beta hydrolase-fold protein [Cellulophaga omnivescoria]WBU88621.1 alpha/beta hydrolase-fold protein [Cellulophaga omnivescoria]